MIFWKKTTAQDLPSRSVYDHHRILVEKDSKISSLSPSELQKNFGIVYLPNLAFPCMSDFDAICRKVAKYRKKGFLDQKQLWLGAYFQKEIEECAMAPVRLRWIDNHVGWGVFAEEDLKPMRYIGEYAGNVRRKKRSDVHNAYCFQYAIVEDESTPYTIDALDQGGIVRFINHSSSPNLMSALATKQNLCHIVLFASRLIRKGEQLCYNYGPDYWKKRIPPQKWT
jgi:hypothetical protein